jgi:hypothetical protein
VFPYPTHDTLGSDVPFTEVLETLSLEYVGNAAHLRSDINAETQYKSKFTSEKEDLAVFE